MSCNCATTTSHQSCAPGTTGLERVNYFPRQIITVEDMVTEAEYFREKLRRHNRYLHGWGVVCGLDVTAAATATAPATVSISGGYALGPYGDEIYVAESVTLDLSRCGPGATTDPCEPDLLHSRPGVGATIFVAIRYSQCLAKPVRAMPAGCACEEEDCEYSRVRDSFEISCLPELPQDPDPSLLCDLRGKLVPCPLPASPWVVLAQVTLPGGGNITDTNIDNTVRRHIFSTVQIQEQVIKSCCSPQSQVGSLLKVENVRFLHVTGSADPTPVLDLRSLQPPLDLTQQLRSKSLASALMDANAIEVDFSDPVRYSSATPNNMTVTDSFQPILAKVVQSVSANTIRWSAVDNSGQPRTHPFDPSQVYTLTLNADPDTGILSNSGAPLDGKVNIKFPSGDDKTGNNFILQFGGI